MNRIASLLRRNDGLTMVEMMVALVLAGIILTASAGALASAMGGVNYSRQNQQSAALISEIIEETRGVDYAAAAVKRDVTALDADSRLMSTGGYYYMDPDGAGPLGSEKLVVSDTGSVPLVREMDRNSTRYTVSTYVTVPTGADAAFRRVTTIAKWTRDGAPHERRASTYVTNTRRGLPLPNFSIGTARTDSVNAGARLRLPVEVTNSGARDVWNMTAATSPSRAWAFAFYADNGDGMFDAADTPLADTDGNGIPDTAALETDEVKKIWAVADIPSSEVTGTIAVSLTATSSSDNAFAESVVDTVNVVGQSCTGCTLVPYYLLNSNGPVADSALQAVMPLSPTPGAAFSGVPNFDTDQDAFAGRTLKRGGTTMLESDARLVSVWEVQMADTLRLGGTGAVTLIVSPQGVEAQKVTQVRAYLAVRTTSGVSEIAMGEASFSFSSSTFSQVTFPIVVPSTTIAKNKWLQLRLIVPGGDHPEILLAYGTGTYPANLTLPKI